MQNVSLKNHRVGNKTRVPSRAVCAVLLSAAMFFLGLSLLSIVILKGKIPFAYAKPCVLIMLLLSQFVCGLILAGAMRKRKLLYTLLAELVYTALILLLQCVSGSVGTGSAIRLILYSCAASVLCVLLKIKKRSAYVP